jgi:hypothetical protein
MLNATAAQQGFFLMNFPVPLLKTSDGSLLGTGYIL